MPGYPAFKEWQAIVGALGAGEQILLLRKGGIAEGRGGFAVRADRFWLFPTAFHAQREKTRPALHRHFRETETNVPKSVRLSSFAEVVDAHFVSDWSVVRRLEPFHFWTEETVKERFEWSRPPGLHAIVVRVFRTAEPLTLALTDDMAGCKSWIEVPAAFDARPWVPALDDSSFATRRAAIAAALPV